MSGLMTESIDIISITKGEVFNLAGHDRGLAARANFDLDRFDDESTPVRVNFPEGFRQVSSSFFQGMFAGSVQKFGSVEHFFAHYMFDAPAHIRSKLADYAEQILNRSDY